MDGENPLTALLAPPGTERPRRFRPRLRYELIGCGLHGHELLGTDAAALRPEDGIFAREGGGLRWYRCLRCDSWVALTPPADPAKPYPPRRDEVRLPLRGRPLRDRYVLRLIALERVFHFLALSALAAAILLFASNKAALNADFTRVLQYVQGGLGGPINDTNHGIVYDIRRLFAVSLDNLYLAGAAVAAYALMEGIEAAGLWLGKRWAEYLTFIGTVIFVPYEAYELTKGVSALKVVSLVLNVAIVAYLLFAKRLFGLRGGGKAERAEHDADTGWAPIERSTPAPATPLSVPPQDAGADTPAKINRLLAIGTGSGFTRSPACPCERDRVLVAGRPSDHDKGTWIVLTMRRGRVVSGSGQVTCAAGSLLVGRGSTLLVPYGAGPATFEAHFQALRCRPPDARAPHFESLAARLNEPRVRRVIEPLIAGELPVVDEVYNDDVAYVRDLGLIAADKPARIANPIYREVIVRILGAGLDEAIDVRPQRFALPDGRYLTRLKLDTGTLVIFDRRRGVPAASERTRITEEQTPEGRTITLMRA